MVGFNVSLKILQDVRDGNLRERRLKLCVNSGEDAQELEETIVIKPITISEIAVDQLLHHVEYDVLHLFGESGIQLLE